MRWWWFESGVVVACPCACGHALSFDTKNYKLGNLYWLLSTSVNFTSAVSVHSFQPLFRVDSVGWLRTRSLPKAKIPTSILLEHWQFSSCSGNSSSSVWRESSLPYLQDVYDGLYHEPVQSNTHHHDTLPYPFRLWNISYPLPVCFISQLFD